MAGWRIKSWDRERARGTIASGIGELPFDAAVAVVDDFSLGEEVDVTLSPRGATFDVLRVQPVAWRAPQGPARKAGRDADLDAVEDAIAGRELRLHGMDDESLVVAIAPQSYERQRSLFFDGCVFVQMPPVMEEVVAISRFAPTDLAREAVELVRAWPSPDERSTVYRLEPRAFGQPAGYVVAWRVRLV